MASEQRSSVSWDYLPLSRTQLLRGAAVALGAASLLLEACGPTSVPPAPDAVPQSSPAVPTAGPNVGPSVVSPQSYDLIKDERNFLVDPQLMNPVSSPSPFLDGVYFYLLDGRDTRVLKLDASFKMAGEMRVLNQEIQPNPGWFLNKPSLFNRTGNYTLDLRLGLTDREIVYLGFRLPGQPCGSSYRGMRAYLFSRDEQGNLAGHFEGVRDVNPADPTFTPRDAEAKGNWVLECLS
jgi:hypothetical protein